MLRNAVVLLGTMCAIPLGALSAEDADARAVVEKGIKAMGPAEELAKYKAESWKASGKMTMMGQTLPYKCEYQFQAPDKFRFVMEANFGGQDVKITAAGADGKAWESAAGQTRDMEPAKLKEFNHQIYTIRVSMLTSLKDPAFKLTLLGDAKSIDGKTQTGVKVSRDGQRDVTLFFDKSTGLLQRSLTRVMDEFTNKEVTQEVIFADYKLKDGLTQFGKMTILRDDKPFIEEELSDYKGLQKLDEALFKKP